MSQQIRFSGAQDMPETSVSLGNMSFNKTGSWRFLRPVYSEKIAPCRHNCPVGTDLPRVLSLIATEEFDQAYELIRRMNPLSSICGRVCYHPCESSCSRASIDSGIGVQALERFVSDLFLDSTPTVPGSKRAEQVAIVGAGPAGLSCANFLAQQGIHVRIFDAGAKPGGMLRLGIPSYRLPRVILDSEINKISLLGVDFELNCRVGRDASFSELKDDFDAVFVATGAHKSYVPGFVSGNRGGILSGLDFLRSVNQGETTTVGRLALIIGGGNTAIDAARSASRLGAQTAIVYRRTREQMPATDEEVSEAEKEGVDFLFLAAPVSTIQTGHGVEVVFQRMELGSPDESGRRRPIPIDDSFFTLEADAVIVAVGEEPDLSFLPVEFSRQDSLFIGGDAETGPSTVSNAILSGRNTAQAILRYLNVREFPNGPSPSELFSEKRINADYFQKAANHRPAHLPLKERFGNFSEIVATLDSPDAIREAQRCISCGTCNHCDNCWVFCPEGAVIRKDGDYSIDLTYCKGCGLCVEECPRGVITLIQEEL